MRRMRLGSTRRETPWHWIACIFRRERAALFTRVPPIVIPRG